MTGSLTTAAARQSRLEEMLGENPGAAALRAAECYDRSSHPFERRAVIYGAGELGRQVLAGLQANGIDALAFVDRNAALWSECASGLPVLSPEDAARRYGTGAVLVVAVWNPVATGGMQQIIPHLKAMGFLRVIPFVWLYWKFPETFLPYYLWDLPQRIVESAEDIRRAYNLFGGSRSQAEFLRQLEFRLTGDFSCLAVPDGDTQYFPSTLFRPREDECFVDCGAYDGDTLRGMIDWTNGKFRKAIALEADPGNFARLEQAVALEESLLGRVKTVQEAVGAAKCKVRFAASGLTSAAIAESGGIEVQCSTLDELVAAEHPTYIKMDIEGAETGALLGASEVLARDNPTLAICSYHVQSDLWKIPVLIVDLTPATSLYLRSYCVNGFELVCYAVPSGRESDRASDSLVEDK